MVFPTRAPHVEQAARHRPRSPFEAVTIRNRLRGKQHAGCQPCCASTTRPAPLRDVDDILQNLRAAMPRHVEVWVSPAAKACRSWLCESRVGDRTARRIQTDARAKGERRSRSEGPRGVLEERRGAHHHRGARRQAGRVRSRALPPFRSKRRGTGLSNSSRARSSPSPQISQDEATGTASARSGRR